MDMSQFVIPKSDQMNYDDLLSGPRTIRITKVSGTGNPDQPVSIHFEGDDGKPWKPCKSMRRVLVAAWGVAASQYVGRSVTLFGDPKVIFGGMAVGGIRISHMSHLTQPLNLALTITKAKRAPYKVQPLAMPKDTGVTGPAPSRTPAVDPDTAAADYTMKGDPSDRGDNGSGGSASAWDRNTESGDYQVGNPFTRETRRFETVHAWCDAVCALAHQRTATERERLWKANAKAADFIHDKFGDGRESAMVAAAHTFVTAPAPIMGSAG